MAIDPELLAEAQRRGLVPFQPGQSAANSELMAEAKRRRLTSVESPSVVSRLLRGLGARKAPTEFDLPDFIGRETPPLLMGIAGGAAGGLAGGAFGAGAGGPPGGIAGALAGRSVGAGTGAGLARKAQIAAGNILSDEPPDESALRTAGIYAGGELIPPALGVVAKKTNLPGVLAKFASVFSGARPHKAEAAIRDLGMISRAPKGEAVEKAYDVFHAASGTQGVRERLLEETGSPLTVSRAKALVRSGIQKLKEGTATPQNLVDASQSARFIKDMSRRGHEAAKEVFEWAEKAKPRFDDALEKLPGGGLWKTARTSAFERSVADEFSGILPQTSTHQKLPSRLITGLATLGGGGAAMAGHPLSLAALPFMTPAGQGAAIRGAYRASQVLGPAARKKGLEALASYELADTELP